MQYQQSLYKIEIMIESFPPTQKIQHLVHSRPLRKKYSFKVGFKISAIPTIIGGSYFSIPASIPT
jgi:hypothetical protein